MVLQTGRHSHYWSMLKNKLNLINELSKIPEVIFVGGTSEYLQGFKEILNDIDISICNKEKLFQINYVFTNTDYSLFGLSGQRGYFEKDGCLVDIFIDKAPDHILVNGFKCQTLESMIELRENTLKFNSHLLSKHIFLKIKTNLERLKLVNNCK